MTEQIIQVAGLKKNYGELVAVAGKVSIAGLDPQRDVRQVRQVVGVQL